MKTSNGQNFRPGKKAFGFRSPRWVISNYFSKVQAKVLAHPFMKSFSRKPQPWNSPAEPKNSDHINDE
jgi:hypothetical protein